MRTQIRPCRLGEHHPSLKKNTTQSFAYSFSKICEPFTLKIEHSSLVQLPLCECNWPGRDSLLRGVVSAMYLFFSMRQRLTLSFLFVFPLSLLSYNPTPSPDSESSRKFQYPGRSPYLELLPEFHVSFFIPFWNGYVVVLAFFLVQQLVPGRDTRSKTDDHKPQSKGFTLWTQRRSISLQSFLPGSVPQGNWSIAMRLQTLY